LKINELLTGYRCLLPVEYLTFRINFFDHDKGAAFTIRFF
jgi:hypothetical protein